MRFKIRKNEYGRIFSELPDPNNYQKDHYDYPVVVGPNIKIFDKHGKLLDQDAGAFIRFRKEPPGNDPTSEPIWKNAFINKIETDGDWVIFDQDY